MRPITLNTEDKTYIYNEFEMKEILKSVGFLWEDVLDFFKSYFEPEKCTGDNWELIADGYYTNMMACREELENIELEQKSEARKLIENFVDENPEAVATLLRNWLDEDWG